MTDLSRTARLAARVGCIATIACVVIAVAVQFEHIVAQNVSVAYQVSTVHQQIATLRERERGERRTVERLSDPRGAVPEIHEKLQLVRPHEELIYVRGLPQATASPNDDWPAP